MNRFRHPIPALPRLTIAVVALSLVALPRLAHATWPPSNLQVSPDVVSHAHSAAAVDGSGGEIVAFEEDYRGSVDLYAIRIGSNGALPWGTFGQTVCEAAGSQRLPVIVSDGSGGAIIAWQDPRSGGSDIYAQRMGGTGAAQWTADGVAICTATNGQSFPRIASDGAGGAIITWVDGRNSGNDVYAQRVNSAGVPQWTADGVAICTAAGTQFSLSIVADGSGGAIIAWQDARSGNNDIYAQRVNASGAVQWTANGAPVCTAANDQDGPTLVSNGAGGAFCAWRDFRGGVDHDVYAVEIGAGGTGFYPPDGQPICTRPGEQGFPSIVSDGGTGAVIAWEDARGVDYDIYAQRYQGSTFIAWAADGVPVCGSPSDQIAPALVQDGSGGAVVSWEDHRNGADYDIYAARITGAATLPWAAGGVPVCTAPRNSVGLRLVPDGFGGGIATWDDSRGATTDVFARRIDNSGSVLWTDSGVELCDTFSDAIRPKVISDAAGGAITLWQERHRTTTALYGQRVDASGAKLWAANGAAICVPPGKAYSQALIPDGSGGAIIAWTDYRNVDSDIYTQRINSAGVSQWTANGVPLCSAAQYQDDPALVSDGVGGAIVAWTDGRSGNAEIYARRVTSAGVPQWTADGVALCTAVNDQKMPVIETDGAGGAIVAWEDQRAGFEGIYARRITSSGTPMWTFNGVPLCYATGLQTDQSIVSDGAGGAIVTWRDERVDSDIYAQRVNASGATQWVFNGIAVCAAAGYQGEPTSVSDLAGGAIVAWSDTRSDTHGDIYAQRIDGSGTAQWAAGGVALCTAPETQQQAGIVTDGSSGALLAWQDFRFDPSVSDDIFTRRVTSAGTPQPPADGAAVCSAPDIQYFPKLASDGFGGAFVVWMDHRNHHYYNAYLHRVIPTGPVAVPVAGNAGGLWLAAPVPNPTPAGALFRFRLPARMHFSIVIHDLQGRLVRRVLDGERPAGEGSVRWDGRDDAGQTLSSAVYFCRLEGGGGVLQHRLIMAR